MINKFSPENFEELIQYTHWNKALYQKPMVPYKKNWLFDQYEIGMDMINEKFGVRLSIIRQHGMFLYQKLN